MFILGALGSVRETCANPFQVRVHAGAFSLPYPTCSFVSFLVSLGGLPSVSGI